MKKLCYSFILLVSFLSATIINVPDDYATIQAGINASDDGDTVLISQGIYFENLILQKEIVLASHAINDDLDPDWINNENINETIISGAQEPLDPNKGSCLVIRYGNIAPIIIGLTFQDGLGTSILETVCETQHQKRSGGAILIYEAYPTIIYNRFLNNGFYNDFGGGNNQINGGVAEGGALSHYDTEDIEFDEDRHYSSNNNLNRTVPDTLNIQNNYFENNASGDGENFYSHGYEGDIDVSGSIFETIDCISNHVNQYVLKSSSSGSAGFIQNDISGECIEENTYYVSPDGNDSSPGTYDDPFLTIGHALTFVRDSIENGTTINVRSGVYSPSTNHEIFPIVLPENIHLSGESRANTILDAEANALNQSRVIVIPKGDNIKVGNFTITGGYHNTALCVGGGGVLIGSPHGFINSVTPILENLIVSDNISGKGGGVFVSIGTNATIRKSKIIDNVVNGYVFPLGSGIAFWTANGSLDEVLVAGNSGNNSYGISTQACNLILNKTTITRNTGMGGFEGYSATEPGEFVTTFINSLIHGNDGQQLRIYDMSEYSAQGILLYSAIGGNTSGNIEYGDGSFDIDETMIVTEEDGYTLPGNSVCRDAGVADLDGDGYEDITDYLGSAPDIGWFEYSIPGPANFQSFTQDTTVTFTWEPVPDYDSQFYTIERATDSIFTSDIMATNEINDPYFIDTNLELNTQYFYRVSAYVGEWSQFSDTISVLLEWLDISDGNQIPKTCRIHQNHPNPFNPVTTLHYDLPEDAMVNITIYDMMGRVVSNLVSSQQRAGYKSVQWNATNSTGQPVSAGMYIYTMQAGEFRQTKKMVLLK